jgi:hypothetical protein
MTIAEKALESDLHSAIGQGSASRIDAAYKQGADLISGVLGRSSSEILRCIQSSVS